MAQAPERFDVTMRRSVDRWTGVTPIAIHLRLVASIACLALTWSQSNDRSTLYYTEHALGLTAATFLFPSLKDLERVYGTRPVAWIVFVLLLGVPLAFASVFSLLALRLDASTFRSAEVAWVARGICAILAAGCWWAVWQVIRIRREFTPLLFKRR